MEMWASIVLETTYFRHSLFLEDISPQEMPIRKGSHTGGLLSKGILPIKDRDRLSGQ
jgi:hypothetical protein